eukprot:EC097282.1.p2 GENE.EC097282.1~~EC097282.1.p2  ORF type:complete len:114 (-),score=5.03 EC097282.1:97-438(-)
MLKLKGTFKKFDYKFQHPQLFSQILQYTIGVFYIQTIIYPQIMHIFQQYFQASMGEFYTRYLYSKSTKKQLIIQKQKGKKTTSIHLYQLMCFLMQNSKVFLIIYYYRSLIDVE